MKKFYEGLKRNSDTIYLLLAVGVFMVTLIPLFIAGFYNHMYCDDFAYAKEAATIITSDTSGIGKVFSLIGNAFSSSFRRYFSWSGVYTSYFFSSLSPCIFGDKYVFLNTFILLGSFIVSCVFSFKWIVIDVLKLDVKKAWVICFSALFVSVQFVPSTAEAYYWYNGSFYNITGYAMGILLFGLLIKLVFYQGKINVILYGAFAALTAFLFAGTNYSSILLYIVLYFFLTVYLLGFGKQVEKKRKITAFGVIMVFYMSSFLSIAAPGNSLRQQAIGEHSSALKAIFMAVINAGQFIKENTSVLLLLSVFITLPFIYSCAKGLKLSYRYPVLVAFVSYILLAVAFTPTLYSLNSIGPARTQNCYFFFYMVLLYSNVFYLCGWIDRKISFLQEKEWCSFGVIVQFAALAGLVLFMQSPIEEVGKMAFVSATSSWLSGDLAEYDRQIKERHEVYNNPDIEDVVLPELTVNPAILSVYENEGLSSDEEYWVNQIIKNYYGKNSVISIAEE